MYWPIFEQTIQVDNKLIQQLLIIRFSSVYKKIRKCKIAHDTKKRYSNINCNILTASLSSKIYV